MQYIYLYYIGIFKVINIVVPVIILKTYFAHALV